MKKDIDIPEVSGVFMAIVMEYNTAFKCNDWYAYLVNTKVNDLEMVLVISRGYDDKDSTSQMRHKLENLPANSYAKIELMQEELLRLNNEFKVTFFENNRLYEKDFIFKKDTVNKAVLRMIPQLNMRGIVVK